MKKIKTLDLLESLKSDSRQVILETNYLLHQDPEILTQQPEEGKWSVAQILEHLNSYGRYYLPLIETSINNERYHPKDYYRPGLLGDYFTKSMLPKKNGQVTNKMQAPKNHRPPVDVDNNKVIQEFLRQEHLLLDLLDRAGETNIEQIRIPISISRFIRLRLGDTFRFLVAHHQRHFVQVNNALASLKHAKTQALRMHGV